MDKVLRRYRRKHIKNRPPKAGRKETLNNGIHNCSAAYYLDRVCGRRSAGRQQMDRQAAHENEMVEGVNKMSKDVKVSAELMELINWLSGEQLSDYEKGIITGLRIAEHIAEIIECNCKD